MIRQRVADEFPQDAILGEEFGEQAGTSGWRWIIDPIDGTKSFIHGVPLYAVLIGIELNEQSQIGVIHLPALDESVYASAGEGAWQVRGNGLPRPARVSQKQPLSEGLFLTSSLSGFQRRGAWPFLERLSKTAKLARTWGDAFGYTLVATGRAEAMVDPALNLWDIAAVYPIIQEAGGRFTDWKGEATIHRGEGIATNGLVHDEVLQLLKA
jgi:histidinol phosphatase-like enzyme (inositol monophosphatase family)